MNHIRKIDVLRGLALLAVFLFHSQEMLFPKFEVLEYKNNVFNVSGARGIFLNFWPIGFAWMAVSLFMIISGFLIHSGYLSSKKKFDVTNFYSKRFWRIYPAYLFAVLFFYVIIANRPGFFSTTQGTGDLLAHLFMVHNFSGKYMYSINPVFWSLAVEMQIYFLYPLILLLRKKTGMLNTLLLVTALALLLQLIGIYTGLDTKAVYRKSALMYLYVWCAGAFFAEKFHSKEKIFTKPTGAIIAVSMALTITCKIFSFAHYFMGYFATIALLAFFEWFLTDERFSGKSKLSTVFSTIGICSYSIYLIHLPFLSKLLSAASFPHLRWLSVVPVFVLIFAIGYPMYLLIEMPFIKFGKKVAEWQHAFATRWLHLPLALKKYRERFSYHK